jgi:hypothetical protein
MEQKTIVALVLGVLVLVSLVQAVQLYGLKSKLSESGFQTNTVSAASPVATSGGERTVNSVPSSVKDLPSMVGGC